MLKLAFQIAIYGHIYLWQLRPLSDSHVFCEALIFLALWFHPVLQTGSERQGRYNKLPIVRGSQQVAYQLFSFICSDGSVAGICLLVKGPAIEVCGNPAGGRVDIFCCCKGIKVGIGSRIGPVAETTKQRRERGGEQYPCRCIASQCRFEVIDSRHFGAPLLLQHGPAKFCEWCIGRRCVDHPCSIDYACDTAKV